MVLVAYMEEGVDYIMIYMPGMDISQIHSNFFTSFKYLNL